LQCSRGSHRGPSTTTSRRRLRDAGRHSALRSGRVTGVADQVARAAARRLDGESRQVGRNVNSTSRTRAFPTLAEDRQHAVDCLANHETSLGFRDRPLGEMNHSAERCAGKNLYRVIQPRKSAAATAGSSVSCSSASRQLLHQGEAQRQGVVLNRVKRLVPDGHGRACARPSDSLFERVARREFCGPRPTGAETAREGRPRTGRRRGSIAAIFRRTTAVSRRSDAQQDRPLRARSQF